MHVFQKLQNFIENWLVKSKKLLSLQKNVIIIVFILKKYSVIDFTYKNKKILKLNCLLNIVVVCCCLNNKPLWIED